MGNGLIKFKCPLCKTKSSLIDKDVHDRYYCAECCVEFLVENNEVTKSFEILVTGELKEITF